MPMQIILLERVDHLGNLGDVVKVKPGYARNFLIPQSKALRATKENIAYFEARKKDIEKQNEERRKSAAKDAGKFEKLTVTIIRHASEGGHLYGSVAARDIADAVTAKSGITVARSMVVMNTAFKSIGLFPVTIALHPEVKTEVTLNIARSEDEAAIQEKTGKALIAAEMGAGETARAEAEIALDEILDDSAMEIEREKAERQAEQNAEDDARATRRAAKKAAQAAKEAAEDAEDEEGDA